ncbi:MAG: molybdenum cofactor biosynthesis protein MoaE [Gammaproteobacteria bacterium]
MHLVTDTISIDRALNETVKPEAGAVIVFSGTVRNHNEGRRVKSIAYSAYRPLTEKILAEIERESYDKFDIVECSIVHRVGQLEIGDTSVLIVVSSVHRAEAFAASRYAIEQVKHRAPIWKLEEYTDGTHSYVKGCSLNERHHVEA